MPSAASPPVSAAFFALNAIIFASELGHTSGARDGRVNADFYELGNPDARQRGCNTTEVRIAAGYFAHPAAYASPNITVDHLETALGGSHAASESA